MRLAGAALACMLSVGCADAEIMEAQSPRPLHDTLPPATAVADSFAIYQYEEEATRPPPRPRHSISLGFVGDEPLSNSVMRDTPMYAPYPTYADPPYPEPRTCSCTAR